MEEPTGVNGRRSSLFRYIHEEKNMAISQPSLVTHLSVRENYQQVEVLEVDQDHPHQHVHHVPMSPSPPRRSYTLDSPWTLSPLRTPSPSLLYNCIISLHRHDGPIHSVAVSNGVLFTGSSSRRICAWRRHDCGELGNLKSSSGEVRAVYAFRNMLFSAHRDHKIRVWSFSDPNEFRAKRVMTLPKLASTLSRLWSGRAIASSSGAGNKSLPNHKECVSCMAYYHAQELLYTGSHDKTVKVWRVSTSQCVDSFVAHDDKVNSIVVNQHDGCVFTCSSDGSIKLWRKVYGESHTLTLTLRSNPSPINALALSLQSSLDVDDNGNCNKNNNNGEYRCFLYSGSSDGTINFWEKEKVSCRFGHGGFLQGHSYGVLSLITVHKLVFSGSEDTTIRVWRREEGSCFHECLAVLDGHRGPVKCLWACLDIDRAMVKGFLVYSASLDQTLKVWRVRVLPDSDDDQHVWLDYNQYDGNLWE